VSFADVDLRRDGRDGESGETMSRALDFRVVVFLMVVVALAAPARAQEREPEHLRGQITNVEASSVTVKTGDGKTVRVGLPDTATILSLSKASWTSVDFGTYVGSVAVRLDMTSPIVRANPRETVTWLYEGYELRIIDEQLRGIAVGAKKWDVPPGSTMTHGWVDDREGRVISIKYGPTVDEETDVFVSRDVPILRMSLGDKSLIKPGVHVFAGVQKGTDGKSSAVFIFVGKDGIVPPL
jgi:hypothetical protein